MMVLVSHFLLPSEILGFFQESRPSFADVAGKAWMIKPTKQKGMGFRVLPKTSRDSSSSFSRKKNLARFF